MGTGETWGHPKQVWETGGHPKQVWETGGHPIFLLSSLFY
jgi:hypothetical protein